MHVTSSPRVCYHRTFIQVSTVAQTKLCDNHSLKILSIQILLSSSRIWLFTQWNQMIVNRNVCSMNQQLAFVYFFASEINICVMEWGPKRPTFSFYHHQFCKVFACCNVPWNIFEIAVEFISTWSMVNGRVPKIIIILSPKREKIMYFSS